MVFSVLSFNSIRSGFKMAREKKLGFGTRSRRWKFTHEGYNTLKHTMPYDNSCNRVRTGTHLHKHVNVVTPRAPPTSWRTRRCRPASPPRHTCTWTPGPQACWCQLAPSPPPLSPCTQTHTRSATTNHTLKSGTLRPCLVKKVSKLLLVPGLKCLVSTCLVLWTRGTKEH